MGHRLERGCCFRINTEGKSEVSVVGFLRSLGQVGLVSLSTILESPPLLPIYTTRKGRRDQPGAVEGVKGFSVTFQHLAQKGISTCLRMENFMESMVTALFLL